MTVGFFEVTRPNPANMMASQNTNTTRKPAGIEPFAWVMVSYSNRLMRFLVNATEPLLGPLRRMIPPVGMFDISPFVAFIIIWLFQAAIAGTLLRS